MEAGTRLSADAPEFKPSGFDDYATGPPEASADHSVHPEFPMELAFHLRKLQYNEVHKWYQPFYVGRLKSYQTRTGYGFIDCPQTYAIYNTDIFLHKNQVVTPFRIGQWVEFAVKVNNKGQPQAQDVLWIPFDAMTMPGPPNFSSKPKEASDELKLDTRYLGTLKSYNQGQGYGFITGDEIMRTFKRDVYLDRQQMPSGPWKISQVVECNVQISHKGMPQARAVNWNPFIMLSSARDGETVDMTAVTHASKLLGFLREGDVQLAFREALDLRVSQADSPVDYLAYALDRAGSPAVACARLDEAIACELLQTFSKAALPGKRRSEESLEWFEAMLANLQNRISEASPQESTALVEALQKAKQGWPGAEEVQDPRYAPVLAQIQELCST